MRQPIGLERLEALEIEQRLDHPQARRVAVGDRHDVGAEGLSDRRIARDRLAEGLANEGGGDVRIVEPRRDPVGDRALERLMVEDRRHQEGGELGLAPHRLLRLLPDAGEQRIASGKPDDPGSQTLRHDELQAFAPPRGRI